MKIAVILAVVCACAFGDSDKSITMRQDLQNMNTAFANEYTAALNMIQKTIDLKMSEKVNCWGPNIKDILAKIPEAVSSQAKLKYLQQMQSVISSVSDSEIDKLMIEVITGEHPIITDLLNVAAAEALAVDDVINKMDINMNCTVSY